MSKTAKTLLIAACVFLLFTIGYTVYSNANMVSYREGNYSDHNCSYDGYGWSKGCSEEAVCKVKYFSSVYYYCEEHADYGKERVESAKTNIENAEDKKNSNTGEGVCKSCGRKFEAGDTAENYMNIARTGMCNNCYNNYKSMSEALGK